MLNINDMMIVVAFLSIFDALNDVHSLHLMQNKKKNNIFVQIIMNIMLKLIEINYNK